MTRLREGLNALELMELDCAQESNFESLGKEDGYELTTEIKKIYGRYERKAKQVDKTRAGSVWGTRAPQRAPDLGAVVR